MNQPTAVIRCSLVQDDSLDRGSVILGAHVNGTYVRCIIPHEYLTAPFAKRLTRGDALAEFQHQRPKIEEKLRAALTECDEIPPEIILHG